MPILKYKMNGEWVELADEKGAAAMAVAEHDISEDAHTDIRDLIENQTHDAGDIVSGILPIERGGTGQSSLSDTIYTTARYRASSLHPSDKVPTINGTISWVYE